MNNNDTIIIINNYNNRTFFNVSDENYKEENRT